MPPLSELKWSREKLTGEKWYVINSRCLISWQLTEYPLINAYRYMNIKMICHHMTSCRISRCDASCYCRPSRPEKSEWSEVHISEWRPTQTLQHVCGSRSRFSKTRWRVRRLIALENGGLEGNGPLTELKGSFTDGSRDKTLFVCEGYRSSGKKEKEGEWQTGRAKKKKGNCVPHGRITEFE